MRAFTQSAVFLVFVATADCFPGFRRSFYPLRPYQPIESGRTPSGFPTYHMPIPTGITPPGGFPTGTGFGPGPTGTTGLPPVIPPYPIVPVGPTGQSSLDNSPTGMSSGSGGQPSDTYPPVVPPITITETETATVTVTAGGGGAPYPTGTGSLPVGTRPIVPLVSPFYVHNY